MSTIELSSRALHSGAERTIGINSITGVLLISVRHAGCFVGGYHFERTELDGLAEALRRVRSGKPGRYEGGAFETSDRVIIHAWSPSGAPRPEQETHRRGGDVLGRRARRDRARGQHTAGGHQVSRCISRRNQRLARARNAERWQADVRVAASKDVERSNLADRIRELSTKVRASLDYPGRADDLAELDRLWRRVAAA